MHHVWSVKLGRKRKSCVQQETYVIIHCHNLTVIQPEQYVSFVHGFSGEMSVFGTVDFNSVHNDVSIEKYVVWKLFCGVKER